METGNLLSNDKREKNGLKELDETDDEKELDAANSAMTR